MRTINVEKIMRSCIRDFTSYVPGKPMSEIKKKYKLKKIVKMASNENVLGPSKNIFKKSAAELKNLYLYPVGDSKDLRDAIADKLGVSAEEVLAGSGSDEIIEMIGRVFFNPGDEVVVSEHAFVMYKMTGKIMDCIVKEVPMSGFKHDLTAMLANVTSSTKAVFIANPNNPTGTYVDTLELTEFLRKLPDNVLVCLDEAYFEYASSIKDYPNGMELFKKGYKNLIVLRTFSKIYALAGIRAGYAVADPAVIAALNKIRSPFNVNSIAQLSAAISIKDSNQVIKSKKLVDAQKAVFYKYLDKMGITYIKSAANFVLINTGSIGCSGMEFFERLLKRGIIVREMSEYKLPDWARITISYSKDMQFLFSEINNIAKENGKKCL